LFSFYLLAIDHIWAIIASLSRACMSTHELFYRAKAYKDTKNFSNFQIFPQLFFQISQKIAFFSQSPFFHLSPSTNLGINFDYYSQKSSAVFYVDCF